MGMSVSTRTALSFAQNSAKPTLGVWGRAPKTLYIESLLFPEKEAKSVALRGFKLLNIDAVTHACNTLMLILLHEALSCLAEASFTTKFGRHDQFAYQKIVTASRINCIS
jgi:hypothetical protein